MAVCVKLDGKHFIQDDANPDPLNCPGWVIPSGSEYNSFWLAQPIEFTSSEILLTFTFGLGAVLSIWAIGYALGIGLALIRKA